jgi:hypothetical protein
MQTLSVKAKYAGESASDVETNCFELFTSTSHAESRNFSVALLIGRSTMERMVFGQNPRAPAN